MFRRMICLRRFWGLFYCIGDTEASSGPTEGCHSPRSDIGFRYEITRYRLAIFLLAALTFLATTSQICRAQENSTGNSWTAKSQQADPNSALNPVRSQTSHSEVDGHIIDKTVMERLGPDGRYVPYSEIERDSVRVNDTTVRSVERSYGRDADGRRSLTQETREEARSFADGAKKVMRTTSNPDGNGGLQVVQRAEIASKMLSPGVRDTTTTLFSADGSGGLGATVQIEERERKRDASTVEFTKSTSLPDGTGHWTVNERREGTTRQESGGTTKEERVLRPDADGKMAVVERTVSKESAGGAGTTETYSTSVPGQAGDEGLQLVRRERKVERTGSGGERQTTKRVEQTDPGDPTAGLHVTQEAIDIVKPGANGVSRQQSTIVTRDANGSMNAVWVDMGSSNKPAALKAEAGKQEAKTAAKQK